MPSHTRIKRPRSGPLAPCLEPLEDRILLSASAPAQTQPAPPTQTQPANSSYDTAPGTKSSDDDDQTYASRAQSLSAARQEQAAAARAAEAARGGAGQGNPYAYYPQRTPDPTESVSAQAAATAQLARLSVSVFSAASFDRLDRSQPVSSEGTSTRPAGDAPVTAAATPVTTAALLVNLAVSAAVMTRTAPVTKNEPIPEPDDDSPPVSATGTSAEQSAQDAGVTRPLLALPLLDIPRLDLGDLSEAARRFLETLDGLAAEAGEPESFWTRLGLWGLAATATVVMFELFREHLDKQRRENLDLALSRGYPEFDFTPR